MAQRGGRRPLGGRGQAAHVGGLCLGGRGKGEVGGWAQLVGPSFFITAPIQPMAGGRASAGES